VKKSNGEKNGAWTSIKVKTNEELVARLDEACPGIQLLREKPGKQANASDKKIPRKAHSSTTIPRAFPREKG